MILKSWGAFQGPNQLHINILANPGGGYLVMATETLKNFLKNLKIISFIKKFQNSWINRENLFNATRKYANLYQTPEDGSLIPRLQKHKKTDKHLKKNLKKFQKISIILRVFLCNTKYGS